jgi:hypothetical protein
MCLVSCLCCNLCLILIVDINDACCKVGCCEVAGGPGVGLQESVGMRCCNDVGLAIKTAGAWCDAALLVMVTQLRYLSRSLHLRVLDY